MPHDDVPAGTPAMTRWAILHPFQVSVASGAAAAGVTRVNDASPEVCLAAGVGMCLLQAILWFPKYGPVRRYSLRYLREQAERGGPS